MEARADQNSPGAVARFLNPHIVCSPLPQDSCGELARRHHVFTLFNPQVPTCVAKIRDSHKQANALLMSQPDIAKAFPDGVPLAYALYPKEEAMPVDELDADKVGGVPDLRSFSWLQRTEADRALIQRRLESEQGPARRWRLLRSLTERARDWVYRKTQRDADLLDAVGLNWPRCGCCHRPMIFLAQLDLTDWLLAIHLLTAQEGPYTECLSSGVGSTDTVGNGMQRRRWFVFVCGNASEHYDNPNCDVVVCTQDILKEDNYPKRSRSQNTLSKPQMRDLLRKFYARVRSQNQQDAGIHKYPEHGDFSLSPAKIVGYTFGWQFDHAWPVDQNVAEMIEKTIHAHPEVFGQKKRFSLFGCPVSQQEEARYWSHSGNPWTTESERMSPLLNFTDHEHDVTYQLYAATRRSHSHRRLFGKCDASCS